MLLKITGNKTLHESEAEQWLEELMETFGDRLTKLAFSYLKDWGKAQEVVQDVFLICYKKRNHMLEIKSVESWIYRVTVNRCKDVLRSSWIKKVIINSDIFHFRRSNELLPEIIVLNKTENEKLAENVLKLPVKYKEVILLFYYEDLSVQEISYVLSTNQNTIKTRLKRGRDILEKNLEGSDYFE